MKNESGFALLEALIAMLIIMIGVLGIAGMQMLAMNNTENGRYQSLAAMLTSSMAAEMQANVAYWGTPPTTVTVIAGTPAILTLGSGTALDTAGTCGSAACTPAQMAYYDLHSWGTLMTAAGGLPSAQGLITCIPAVSPYPPYCTLTMIWSENNIALTNRTGAETGALATGTQTTGSVATGTVTGNNHSYTTAIAIQQ